MTTDTTIVPPAGSLRRALRIDGWWNGAFGVLLLGGGAWLREPLGLPTSWSVPLGVAMLGGAWVLLLIAGYPSMPKKYVQGVVAVNLGSAVALVVIAGSGVLELTGLGIAFLLSGAVADTAFAAVEYSGLRAVTI